MSFFLGGSERAAPVLVKHIAKDLCLGGWRSSVGVWRVAYDGGVAEGSPGRKAE